MTSNIFIANIKITRAGATRDIYRRSSENYNEKQIERIVRGRETSALVFLRILDQMLWNKLVFVCLIAPIVNERMIYNFVNVCVELRAYIRRSINKSKTNVEMRAKKGIEERENPFEVIEMAHELLRICDQKNLLILDSD